MHHSQQVERGGRWDVDCRERYQTTEPGKGTCEGDAELFLTCSADTEVTFSLGGLGSDAKGDAVTLKLGDAEGAEVLLPVPSQFMNDSALEEWGQAPQPTPF